MCLYQLQVRFRTGYKNIIFSYVSLWKKRKPFGDGEFIKNCLTIFTECACLEKKHLMEQTNLSHSTVSRRTNDLSDNIKVALRDILKSCAAFSLALGESKDTSVTALHLTYIVTVTVVIDAVEEFF